MPPQLVVIGTSLGGLTALETLLAGLPETFPLPIAVVQHRSAEGASVMRAILQRHTGLRVREPEDKDPVLPGRLYIAPPDYHLLLEEATFSLSTDPPVWHARPSIDVLFESAADAYGRSLISVVLTGANGDGAAGAARVKRFGGKVIVQDPDYAECPVMPRAALAAVKADFVVHLEEIADLLRHLAGGTGLTAHPRLPSPAHMR